MKNSILDLLHCPICHEKLAFANEGKSCKCEGIKSHCFDFSKSGYLNLSGPHGGMGDQKDAIRSRSLFLNAGYYQPLADYLSQKLDLLGVKRLLDAGCGEGYYTNRFAAHRDVIGADLSKDGIDTAAKASKHQQTGAGFIIASLFSLPIPDKTLDAVINIFAPCAEEEYTRVLKDGGYLFVVGAGKDHLMGLKRAIYDNVYENGQRADLPEGLEHIEKIVSRHEICVEGKEDIAALFSMTPYCWRTSESDHQRLNALDTLQTEVEFEINVYRK